MQKKYSLSTVQAFNFLDRFNAIDFVNQHYNITHPLPFAEIIDDLATYLVKNFSFRVEQALRTVYNSELYKKLCAPKYRLVVSKPPL